ncbi:MAG: hypothetical protein ACRDKW_18380 [Actinomycetota bacterium]
MKTLLGVACTVAVLLALAVAAAAGSPPEEEEHAGLVRSTITDPIEIERDEPSDVVMLEAVMQPGDSSGWHADLGPALVAVAAGSITVYRPVDDGCTRNVYGPGEGFFEAGGDVDLVRNEGTEPALLHATVVLPAGGELEKPAESPGGDCPE